MTIIIPQHGFSSLTIACVRSIAAHETVRHDVIVVDDGSSRENVTRIRKELPGVRCLSQPWRGVTAAWNAGIAAAESEYVVLLNNDVAASGRWLARVTKPLRAGDALITGAAWRTERAIRPQQQSDWPVRHFLQGWCLAMARETWGRVGGFDESLKLYFSDTDFQLRVCASDQRGCDALQLVEGLPLWHAGHRTTSRLSSQRAQWRRDRDVFMAKWAGECESSRTAEARQDRSA